MDADELRAFAMEILLDEHERLCEIGFDHDGIEGTFRCIEACANLAQLAILIGIFDKLKEKDGAPPAAV